MKSASDRSTPASAEPGEPARIPRRSPPAPRRPAPALFLVMTFKLCLKISDSGLARPPQYGGGDLAALDLAGLGAGDVLAKSTPRGRL